MNFETYAAGIDSACSIPGNQKHYLRVGNFVMYLALTSGSAEKYATAKP
jgi:hypothetical protein